MRAFRIVLLLAATTAQAQTPSLGELQQRAVADSNNPTTHYQLAMAYWDKKDWDGAEASLRTALKIAPAYADAMLALAVVGPSRGKKYWKDYAKAHGDSSVTRIFRETGSLYRRAFQLDPMVNLRPLEKYQPESFAYQPGWYAEYRKGIAKLYQGDYKLAYFSLQGAYKLSGSIGLVPEPVIWSHALAAAHLDSFEVAAQDFTELSVRAMNNERQHPEESSGFAANDYRFFLATMLYLGGHFNDAVSLYQQVLEKDLSLYVAHVQMARMYEQSEMWDQAIAERRRALDANPEDPALMVELASTLLQRSQMPEALTLLDQAARLNPRDARIPYLKGHAALSTGDPEGARRFFQEFLAIAPSTFARQAVQIRAQLEKMK